MDSTKADTLKLMGWGCASSCDWLTCCGCFQFPEKIVDMKIFSNPPLPLCFNKAGDSVRLRHVGSTASEAKGGKLMKWEEQQIDR